MVKVNISIPQLHTQPTTVTNATDFFWKHEPTGPTETQVTSLATLAENFPGQVNGCFWIP